MILLCVVAGIIFAVAVARQIKGSFHFYAAKQSLRDGELPDARDHLHRCLAIWPNDAASLLLMAQTHRREGDFLAASRYLEMAFHQGADISLETQLLRAQQNEFAEVEPDLRRRLRSQDSEIEGIVEVLVLGYLRSGELEKAYYFANGWVEGDEQAWYPRYLRAQVIDAGHRGGLLGLAIDDYRFVISERPDHLGAHLRLAKDLLLTGQSNEALKHFQIVLHGKPEEAEAALGLTQCLSIAGKPDDGFRLIKQWLGQHVSDNPRLFLVAGQVAMDTGHLELAQQWLERSEQLEPEQAEVLFLLARLYRRLGHTSKAESYEARKAKLDQYRRSKETSTPAPPATGPTGAGRT